MISLRSRRRVVARFVRALAIVGVLSGVFVASAFATQWYSQYGYINNVGGHSYINVSVIDNGSPTDAISALTTQDQNSVPAGYMGIDARAYHTNGQLCEQSGYLFNSAPAVGLSEVVWYLGNTCGAGFYYSQGVTPIWTGSTYNYYNTFQTIGIYAP